MSKNSDKIKHKLGWTNLLGVVMGILGLALTIFSLIKEADLTVAVENVTPIISVNKDIPELKITLNDEDVRKQGKAISIVTIRISNNGQDPVVKSDFDENDPLTLKIINGKIIRSDLANKSSSYFQNVWNLVVKNEDSIIFPSFILDPDDKASFELLVLHNQDQIPKFRATGKIAGLEQIKLIDDFANKRADMAFSSVYDGGLKIQATRILIYGFGTVILLVASAYFMSVVMDFLYERKRKIKKDKRNLAANEMINSMAVDDRSALLTLVPMLSYSMIHSDKISDLIDEAASKNPVGDVNVDYLSMLGVNGIFGSMGEASHVTLSLKDARTLLWIIRELDAI